MNLIVISGNLGRDPELRYSENGSSFLYMSVAVQNRRSPGQVDNPPPMWFNVTVFGKSAENCAKYLKKGNKVGVSGRFETSYYQDSRTGEQCIRLNIIANDVEFLTPKSEQHHEQMDTEQPELSETTSESVAKNEKNEEVTAPF